MKITRWILLLVLAVFSSAGRSARGEDERQFQVDFTVLGPDTATVIPGELQAAARRFARKLNARKGLSAVMTTGKRPRKWHGPSAGPGDRLSVVAVIFGSRCDWLAFTFGDPGGAALLAERRPAMQKHRPGVYLHSIPPGAEQATHNAVAELAADAGHGLLKRRTEKAALINIEVVPWPKDEDDMEDGDDLMVDDDDVPEPANRVELKAVKALAFAAAGELGLRAATGGTGGDADYSLKLSLGRRVDVYAIEASLSAGGRESEMTRLRVERAWIYEDLVNILRSLISWRGAVSDYLRVDLEACDLLGYADEKLYAARGGELWAMDLTTGREAWRTENPPRSTPVFAALPGPQGEFTPYQYSPALCAADLENGGLRGLAENQGAGIRWGFDILQAGDAHKVALVRERELKFFKGGKLSWKFEGGDLLGLGPRFHRGNILVGGDTGEIFCFSPDKASPRWRRQLEGRLRGRIALIDDLAIAGTVEGTLYALSPADGEVVWRHDLGGLAICVEEARGGILAAGKNSVLRLLDPASGAVRAESRSSGWLSGVKTAAGGKLVARADNEGNVAFLDGDKLEVVRSVALNTRLCEGMLVEKAIPLRWGIVDELMDQGDAVIVHDARGFAYAIPIPEEKK